MVVCSNVQMSSTDKSTRVTIMNKFKNSIVAYAVPK